MDDALTAAIHAAMQEASEQAILPRYRSLAEHEVISKAADDVVTVADHEAEEILTEHLSNLLPEASIVGEEAAHTNPAILDRLGDSLCWIIDPLDGTNNYATGKPPFGVLVALAEAGETIGGWIYDCLSGRFCHAQRGLGAFLDGERITAKPSDGNPPVAAISLIFLDDAQRERIKAHIAPHYRLVDIPRCAAEQYPRLALGQNDVSIFERTLPWDHAAGVLFLNEAGGKAARPDGSAYRPGEYDHPGLLGASSPRLWNELAHRIAEMENC
ncbi:MAG: inositol monophosphatase family protein [Novosphingobium sp.]|nr:inositol monophosphatase family protein [Novosphingobium sp.]